MLNAIMIIIFLVYLTFPSVEADFKCVCNYNIEKGVFPTTSEDGKAIGYLYEFDCKPIVSETNLPGEWSAVAFEHQKGYVLKDPQTKIEVCQGEPLSTDLLSATNATTSTTTEPTTTTQSTKTTTTQATTTTQPTTTTTQPTTPAPVYVCPSTIQQGASQDKTILFINTRFKMCYEIVTQPETWSGAENSCKMKGGHLVTLSSATDEQVLYQYVRSYGHETWIGLNDLETEETFRWTSGKPVVYLNWYPGRKSVLSHDIEDCVAIGPNTGTWQDMDCSLRHAYVCEYNAVIGSFNDTNLQVTTTPQSSIYTDGDTSQCPANVVSASLKDNSVLGQYKTGCYELIPNIRLSWAHGEQMCVQRGGHLAYISTVDEQGFMNYFLNRYSSRHAVWIGLHDTKVENHFEWTSGSSVTYTNWVPGHLNNFGAHEYEDCVAFIPYKDGKWDDIHCGENLKDIDHDLGEVHPVICQYDVSTFQQVVG